jgi:anti-sigma factor RsiW
MNPERNDQINAYLSGTMPPEEARRFERLLREDAELEREVRLAREDLDAARQWAAAEAPNAQERAARLKIPHLEWHGRPARESFSNAERRVRPATEVDLPVAGSSLSNAERGVRPSFVRYLAAAALFAAGILVGAMLPRETPPGGPPGTPRDRAVPGPGVVSPALPASATPAPEKQVIPPEVPVAPRPALADAGRNAPKEEAAPPARGIAPLRVVESGGERLVLESTLVGSGGRATWVVDGSFRLAENKAGGV